MLKQATIAAFLILGLTAAEAQPAMQSFAINDPVLQMPAWSLAVPAGWTAEGTMLPGSSCLSVTTPVYRAVRADGQAGADSLPRVDWAWGPGTNPGRDCLPQRQVISARDYLTTMLASEKLGWVRDEPVPELATMRENMRAQDQQTQGMRRTTVDMARDRVRYEVAGKPVEESISAIITCFETRVMAVGVQHSCIASVSRWYAPLGQLDALLPTFQAMKLSLNPAWMQRWSGAMQQRFRNLSAQQTKVMLAQGEVAQAARMRQHQAFMTNFQQAGDARNQAFKAGQYAKQRHADDFNDYVLDCSRAYSQSGNTRVSVGANCPNRQTY